MFVSLSKIRFLYESGGSDGKESACNAGDPGSGRSPGGGHGSTLSMLAWRIPWTEEPGGLVRGIAESDTAAQPALSLSPGKYPEQRFYNILPYPVCTQVFPILSKMFLFYFLIVG